MARLGGVLKLGVELASISQVLGYFETGFKVVVAVYSEFTANP